MVPFLYTRQNQAGHGGPTADSRRDFTVSFADVPCTWRDYACRYGRKQRKGWPLSIPDKTLIREAATVALSGGGLFSLGLFAMRRYFVAFCRES
jgi:hypothetical protein